MIVLTMRPGYEAASAVASIKFLSWEHPGDERLTVHVAGRDLLLGREWTYAPTRECVAALEKFGPVEMTGH